jgi:hypothetical protein
VYFVEIFQFQNAKLFLSGFTVIHSLCPCDEPDGFFLELDNSLQAPIKCSPPQWDPVDEMGLYQSVFSVSWETKFLTLDIIPICLLMVLARAVVRAPQGSLL